MGLTSNYQWRYPSSTDAPDVPQKIRDLAEDIDGDLPALLVAVLTGMLTGSDAGYAQVLTTQTTASTSYVDLATVGPSVTLTSQGTKALCIWSSQLWNDTAANGAAAALAISGATTLAASDDNALGTNASSSGFAHMGCQFAFPTINAGTNTFKLQYRVVTATNGNFSRRRLFVFAP